MKKLNYLIVLFVVLFTLGFSSCGDENVLPKDDQQEEISEKEKLENLLNGNIYEGEVYEHSTYLKDITIEFVNSGADSGRMELEVTDGKIFSATSWKINDNGNILMVRVNHSDSEVELKIDGKITESQFSFIRWEFNDGEEPVTMTKVN